MTNLEKEIYDTYVNYIREHDEICRAKAPEMKEYLAHSNLFYNGDFRSMTLMVPKVYAKETFEKMRGIQETIHAICNKVVRHYLDDPDYRSIFPYSDLLQELILTPSGYDTLLPMARYDIFYNEETGDFKFCEFNTDGTSGMDENRVHDQEYTDNPAHQHVMYRYHIRPFELFESWAREFIKVYHTWNQAGEIPHIAIVDFFDAGRVTEFKEFSRVFQQLGVKCCVCDIRDLTYDGHRLSTPLGFEVDAIYKRACGGDVLDRVDQVPDFIRCIKDGNVFLCSSFASQIVHNKWIFQALWNQKTHEFLTEEEVAFVKRHVPRTEGFVTEELKQEVLASKDDFILKPQDGYASSGIYAGVDSNQAEWEQIVEECFRPEYLVQEYVRPYRTLNADYCFGDGHLHEYINMTGLYSYNGKLAGFFNRQSDGAIIRTYVNERTVPTYLIEDGRREGRQQ